MSKQEFLERLREGLSGLPKNEVEERLNFYSEMIEDRIEEGFSEEVAVEEVGNVEEIIRETVADTPLTKIVKERIKPSRRLNAWEVVLLALGSPIWLSIGISVVAVLFSVYISLWAVICSLWAVFGAILGSTFAGLAGGIVLICKKYVLQGIALIAAGLVCAGVSIFIFYGCKLSTDGILLISKKLVMWIKNCFRKKEEA